MNDDNNILIKRADGINYYSLCRLLLAVYLNMV